MKKTESNFRKMEKMGILSVQEHVKIKNEPYMPLSIDRLAKNRLSIAHNFIQNGDLMADPDMEIEIDLEQKTVEALTYQQDGLGIYQRVYEYDEKGQKIGVRRKLKQHLNAFLENWLNNLKSQGFKIKPQTSQPA